MKPVIDTLNDSAVQAVRKSGLATETARSGRVTGVNNDGTITVAVAEDEYTRVRMVGFPGVIVDDRVTILRTVGGWVCLGAQWTGGTGVWHTANLISTFAFKSNTRNLSYRRVGNQVDIQGAFTNVNSMSADSWNVFALPGDCTPPYKLVFPFSGPAVTAYQAAVNTNGYVELEALPSFSAGKQFSLNFTFWLN